MSRLPLQGFRALEVGAYISAPYVGSLLAAMGADVVKVEPLDGEAFRRGQGTGDPYFYQYNAGKRSIAVDLKSPAGVAVVHALLPRFDVLYENMRPGKMDALGLGAARCAQVNPQLVYASISGFGSSGPLRDRPAYDTIGQSYGGVYTVMNDPGQRRLTGTCIADLNTAICASLAILAALAGRERGPERGGTHIETSVFEAISALTIDAMTLGLATGEEPVRESRHPQALNFCLQTSDGEAITVHLSSSDKFWRSLITVAGHPELVDDPRFRTYAERSRREHHTVLKSTLEPVFLRRTRAEWERLLTDADVPHAPVLGLHEVARHPQTQHLELLHPAESGRPALVRPPWRLDGERPRRDLDAPNVGAHTADVLLEVMSQTELDELVRQGVVAVGGGR